VSGVEIFLAFVKILIIIGFLLNMAAIATWADRRQSAMVQDRIGPNRAVVFLPSIVVRLLVAAPAWLLAAAAFGDLAIALMRGEPVRNAGGRMTLDLELAILVGWFSVLVLTGYVRRREAVNGLEQRLAVIEPPKVFYAGLALHAAALGATAVVPEALAPTGALAGRALLGLVLSVTGIYAASRVPEGKIGLRLAGMLHAAADAMKLIWKEDFVPKNADRLLHSLAPMIAMFPALVTFAVIPFGDSMCFADNGNGIFDFGDLAKGLVPVMADGGVCRGHAVPLQIADLNVGILYLFALASTGVIGAAIAGWASDNKFALLGGLRAASQMVSYEVAMGLSLVGLFAITGSVHLGKIVEWQSAHAWGVFVQPVGFVLFLTALAAETKRVPFDQPEGESEIVAGYFLEYSGMKFGMFFTGEYVDLIVSSALLTTLFFGGYSLPFLHDSGVTVRFGESILYDMKMSHLAVVLVSVIAFFAKTIFVTWVQIFFRWTLPRFRYDQLMKLGWTKLLPAALANMLVTGLVVLAVTSAPEGVGAALQLAGDVTMAIVAIAMFVGAIALVAGLLEPTKHKRFLGSTAARFAEARGGVKPEPQQA
jgi:NADH-quinone oxidoreductase subunit H